MYVYMRICRHTYRLQTGPRPTHPRPTHCFEADGSAIEAASVVAIKNGTLFAEFRASGLFVRSLGFGFGVRIQGSWLGFTYSVHDRDMGEPTSQIK